MDKVRYNLIVCVSEPCSNTIQVNFEQVFDKKHQLIQSGWINKRHDEIVRIFSLCHVLDDNFSN